MSSLPKVTPSSNPPALALLDEDHVMGTILSPGPSRPPQDRPGTNTFIGATADYGLWRVRRIGLTLEGVIEEEVEDYMQGRRYRLDHGMTDERFADSQPDIGVWVGERLEALIRPRPGNDGPLVIYPDHWPDNAPETEEERRAWGIIQRIGIDAALTALEAADHRRSQAGLAKGA